MTLRQALVMVLVVAVLVMAFRPAPAEAMEPMVILAIVGAAVIVVILVVYLVVANVEEHRQAHDTQEGPLVVVYAAPTRAVESP